MASNKDELIDYSIRTGAPLEVVENLQAIEDEGDLYESIQEIWPIIQLTKITFGMKMNISSSYISFNDFLYNFLKYIR